MVVQHNLSAMNAHRQLGINNTGTSRNLEKLSSGYRINKAGDDAAGLAISEKMRGQIRGLDMATNNAENGVSLIQTAEGALNETHAILQRMRELAVQSSNGTYSDEVDRENLDKEVQALKSEIDRISSSTHYNGIKLLDGTLGGTKFESTHDNDFNYAGFGISGGSFTITNAHASIIGQEMTITVKDEKMFVQIGDRTYDVTGKDKILMDDGVTTLLGLGGTSNQVGYPQFEGVARATIIANAAGSGTPQLHSLTPGMLALPESELTFQIGANGAADQKVGLHVDNMSSANLGSEGSAFTATDTSAKAMTGNKVTHVKVDTQDNANDSITILNDAINQVSTQRADLGALQNRLEHTINNLGTTRENLQAAESSIRDVDMAKEMMEFTKNNILSQASQSMLAQANQLPQGVLQLLR